MTKPIYEVIEETMTMAHQIKKTNPDGSVWFIPIDEANSDYQVYLATLVTESAPTA